MLTTTYLTATGNVGVATGGVLAFVVLTAGSDAATLTLKQGGSGGAVIMVLKAAADTSVAVPIPAGLTYYGQLHATFTGTGPAATFATSS